MAASAAATAAQAQAQAQAQAHAHAHAHQHHHHQHPPLPSMSHMPMPQGWQSNLPMSLPPPLVSNLVSSPSMIPFVSRGPSRPSSAADAESARRATVLSGHLGSLPPPMFAQPLPPLPQGSSHPPYLGGHSAVLGQPYPINVYGLPSSSTAPVQLLQGVGEINLMPPYVSNW
jgi:hypothetical protein